MIIFLPNYVTPVLPQGYSPQTQTAGSSGSSLQSLKFRERKVKKDWGTVLDWRHMKRFNCWVTWDTALDPFAVWTVWNLGVLWIDGGGLQPWSQYRSLCCGLGKGDLCIGACTPAFLKRYCIGNCQREFGENVPWIWNYFKCFEK